MRRKPGPDVFELYPAHRVPGRLRVRSRGADHTFVFDPERDFDPGVRPFYVRIVAVALVTGAACVAAWPSVTGFAAGPDHNTGCVAVANGWHSEPAAPSAADIAAAKSSFPAPPSPAQESDRTFMAHWQAQFRAGQDNPVVIRATARISWLAGPGACVPESRHRMLLSGVGLGCIGLATLAVWLACRARTAARLRAFGAFT